MIILKSVWDVWCVIFLNTCSDLHVNKAPCVSFPSLYHLEVMLKMVKVPNIINIYSWQSWWYALTRLLEKSSRGNPKPFSVHVWNHLEKNWEPILICVMVIDRFHKYHKKCSWLCPNGQDPHYKPHIILIIIMLCID